MRILVTLVLATALLVFAVWSRVPGNLPSGFFKMMDRNHDFAVTYAEWKAEAQPRSDWPQREWDFHSMDCNSDQRLTWLEYRRVVFKHGTRCGKNTDLATRPRAPGSFSYCDTDAQGGMRRCVLGSDESITGPPAGPMQRLEIPD